MEKQRWKLSPYFFKWIIGRKLGTETVRVTTPKLDIKEKNDNMDFVLSPDLRNGRNMEHIGLRLMAKRVDAFG